MLKIRLFKQLAQLSYKQYIKLTHTVNLYIQNGLNIIKPTGYKIKVVGEFFKWRLQAVDTLCVPVHIIEKHLGNYSTWNKTFQLDGTCDIFITGTND